MSPLFLLWLLVALCLMASGVILYRLFYFTDLDDEAGE